MPRSHPVLLLVLLASCDPFHTELEQSTPRLYEAAEPTAAEPPTSLVVMDWNVKFGGARIDFFFDCFGERVLMTRDEVVTNLEGLAAKIREVNPDVLLLQEVDVNSKRSAFLDQLQWLLDHTELNHAVYASHWQADFIPSDGLGAMDNGSAILSRWPIAEAERHALPLRTDQSSLTRYFYLRRNVLSARLELPAGSAAGRDVWVVNVHTDAYGEDGTKLRHIDGFSDVMNALDDAGAVVIGGGDLNALPPGAEQQHDFPDSVCEDEEFIADDYRPEADWLDPLFARYAHFVPLADIQADNARHFTHTVDGRGYWNRQLDYLFTNQTWRAGSGVVHQDRATGLPTMPLSDHAPIVGEVVLP